jgi:hypothetical protein
MALDSLPKVLENTELEHCFESCLGMTLAHYGKLGNLSLQDIVAAVSRPGEEVTPMARTFEWLQSFGLQVEYIEAYDESASDFISSLQEAGVITRPIAPTMEMAIQLANEGKALITQINYTEDEGQVDFELNHAVYLGELGDEDVLLIDPDGAVFGVDEVTSFWGRFPNLISVALK